jgi:prolyl-tRNA synthetase
MLARRDTGEKVTISMSSHVKTVQHLLQEIQRHMYQKALHFQSAHVHVHIDTLDELQAHILQAKQAQHIVGWVLAGWCGVNACETKVKEETSFTTRNIPFEPPISKQICLTCGQPAKHTVWFARAY